MPQERTLIERAFDIANEGECRCPAEIAEKLKAEGFGGGQIERHMDGSALKNQLSALCRDAQAKATAKV